MHPAIKLIIGLIIFIAGIVWYAEGLLFGQHNIANFLLGFEAVHTTFQAFAVVFTGVFGLVLIFFGLIVAWIEYEDLKWERREKKAKAAPAQVTVAIEEPAHKKK
ncbi:MAG: hypothetical protein ABIG30_02615 [Candidatus Aenigmatarchaeota archaeon]